VSAAGVAACLVVALAVAGCGDEDGAPDAASAPANVITRSIQPLYAGDPDATRAPRRGSLRDLADVRRADSEALAPKIRGSDRLTVAQFLATISNDVAAFWQQALNEAGYAFAPVPVFVVTGEHSTRCDPPRAYDTNLANAFYCRADPAIHLPVGFFERRIAPVGDMAAAFVVAHEWAHRVQDVLGLLTAAGITGRQLELQADCLGGVWSSTVLARDLFERGDLEEAVALTSTIGDAPDTPVEQQHGTARERIRAFLTGYSADGPADCAVAATD
jgi:uncharacterized protein